MKRNRRKQSSYFSRMGGLLILTATISTCVTLRTGSDANLMVMAQEEVANAEVPSPSPTPTTTPTPTLTPTLAPVVAKANPERDEIEAEIKRVFGSEADNAFAILSCENKTLNPNAINHNRNGSVDFSIFQVNSIHTKRFGSGFKTDWKENIRVAHEIFLDRGWEAWSCSHTVGVTPFYLR